MVFIDCDQVRILVFDVSDVAIEDVDLRMVVLVG